MAPSSIFRSKWLLAALLILGLIYFEGRIHSKLIDNEATSASFAR